MKSQNSNRSQGFLRNKKFHKSKQWRIFSEFFLLKREALDWKYFKYLLFPIFQFFECFSALQNLIIIDALNSAVFQINILNIKGFCCVTNQNFKCQKQSLEIVHEKAPSKEEHTSAHFTHISHEKLIYFHFYLFFGFIIQQKTRFYSIYSNLNEIYVRFHLRGGGVDSNEIEIIAYSLFKRTYIKFDM